MIKQRTIIEVEISGRPFRLECCSASTWEEVVSALSMMHEFSMERIKAIPPAPQESVKEESPKGE